LLYEWASIPGRSAGAWLEGRFVTSPADAMRFLKLLRRERDGWGWNFHPASALIAEPILRDALQAYVARPELDPGFSADDLALAQRFIADHTPQPTTGQQQAETL
jgi:hypothetical protein